MPQRPKAISHGRPPLISKDLSGASSRTTRSIIRKHHNLQKSLARALADNDTAKASALSAEIESHGGLRAYQAASAMGQSTARGGDSSKVLVEWLSQNKDTSSAGRRLLEVGALETTNACSKSGLFDEIVRIDLRARGAGIEKQDFMERPLPKNLALEGFDVISLSLVVNYVPDARGRGDMLRRTTQFLRTAQSNLDVDHFPSVFLVLPAPCVTNSRYFDEVRLTSQMESLGFSLAFRKLSAKLAYYLWKWNPSSNEQRSYPKVEINPGRSRNNFVIILE